MRRPEATYHLDPPRIEVEAHGEPGVSPEVLYELTVTIALNPVNIGIPRDDVMYLEYLEGSESTFLFSPDTELVRTKHAPAVVDEFNRVLKFYEDMNPRDMISLVALAYQRAKRGY